MDRFGELLRSAPGIVGAAADAARRRSPLVAALPEDEVRRHVQAMIEAAITAITDDREIGEADLRAAERLGADRARQGVPVAALLDGFQAGRSLLVRTVIERGRASNVPADDLLDGVTRIDAVATALEHRMVHAHRVAELEMARTTRDAHVQVLRRVLHGEPGDPAPLDSEQAYHVLAADVSDPALAAKLERGMRGLSGLVDGRFAALVERLPELADGPLVVASPRARLDEAPVLYGLCRQALGATGRRGLCRLTDLALATATTARPELGRLLAAELLTGLDPGDDFHRQLASTVLSYLDHGSRLEPAAHALHVHPNTVKYRVRRFAELTGRSPVARGIEHDTQLWWALRSWFSDARRRPGH